MDKNVLKNLSYGLYVIGAKGDKNCGCIINTVFQITSNPTVIAVSINHNNYTNQIIKQSKKFSISILKETTNPEVIGIFGYHSSKDMDKFAQFDYEEKDDIPILKDNCGVLICEVQNEVETDTHTLFIAKVTDMSNYSQENPMTYKYYQETLKGKSPKNAPTYIAENSGEKSTWRCEICGYEVNLEDLPEDYVCPICGAPAKMFKKSD